MGFRSRRRAEIADAVAESTERLTRLVREQADTLATAQATLLESVATTRLEMARREEDLVQVLQLVSELCRNAIDVVEAERDEHHAFLASFAEVVRSAIGDAAIGVPGGPTLGSPTAAVVGGTVFASHADLDLSRIEDEEAPARDAPVDVELPFH